jgi:predicted nucleic acid-binding protein
MEPTVLGLVLDSSVLVAAERKKLTTPEAIRKVREAVGEETIAICSRTVAELAHGIYRADTTERSRMRRQFLDELKAHVWPILSLELELGYAIGTSNVRDFNRIPGLNVIRL